MAPWLVTAGVVGTAVALLAVARRAGRDTPPLTRSLRSLPRSFAWQDHLITYYEAGDGAATPVLLVHGIHAAASAREMRMPFSRLAADHRVLAYDLLGYGASERPALGYRADHYIDLLRDMLREVVGGPAHVIASSLSGAHALELAAEEPELFRSLTVINPTGLVVMAQGQGLGGSVLEAVLRTPFLGEGLFNLLVSRPSLRHYTGRLYHEQGGLVDDGVDHAYTTAHQENARFAPAAFLGQALASNVEVALDVLRVPTLAVWTAEGGAGPTDAEREAYAERGLGLRQVFIDDCGALPHEERPDELVAVWREFIAGLPTTEAPPA